MEIKGYHIISLEAKDIYEQELINGVEKGYVMPSKNNRVYFGLFKNVLDYSLDLIEIEKCYYSKCRNSFSFEDEYQNKYTLSIINLKFTYTYKDENNGKDLKQLREYFLISVGCITFDIREVAEVLVKVNACLLTKNCLIICLNGVSVD